MGSPVLGEQDHEDLSGMVAEAAGRDELPGVADQELREGDVRSSPGCREGVAPGRTQEVLAVGVPPRREDGCVSTEVQPVSLELRTLNGQSEGALFCSVI